MQQIVLNMIQKGIGNGKVNVKIDISLEQKVITEEKNGKDVNNTKIIPRITYVVANQLSSKVSNSGKADINGDYYLTQDESGLFSILWDNEQTKLF